MIQPIQHSQEIDMPSIGQIIDAVSTKLARVIDATITAPFQALKNLAFVVAKPIAYGSVALTAIHIAVRPNESKEIARNVLYASPKIIENMVTSAPAAFRKAGELSARVYDTTFHALGNKVGLPESQQTVPAVLKGLIENSPKFAKELGPKVGPAIVKSLDAMLTQVGKGLNQAVGFSKETAAMAANKFNATFPASQSGAAV